MNEYTGMTCKGKKNVDLCVCVWGGGGGGCIRPSIANSHVHCFVPQLNESEPAEYELKRG